MTAILRHLLMSDPRLGVEVPGLFTAWIRGERVVEFRDYLGRPAFVGRAGRALTLRTSLRFDPSESDSACPLCVEDLL